MEIRKFDGKHDYLSNFYICDVEYEGLMYLNSEAAFQAAKTTDITIRKKFRTMTPSESKKKGRKLRLRSDWDEIKSEVMYEIVKDKFTRNEDLKKLLLETEGKYIIEGNWWHDNCWGDCYCEKCTDIVGENRLGKILMQVCLGLS